jgi:hypothetical protein
MISHRTWLRVAILSAIFATNANAQTEIDKLRKCLTIEDGSKERLDCYDGIIPPNPKPKPPVAKAVADCKFLKERTSDWVVSIALWYSQRPLRKLPEKPLRNLNRQNEQHGRAHAEGQGK